MQWLMISGHSLPFKRSQGSGEVKHLVTDMKPLDISVKLLATSMKPLLENTENNCMLACAQFISLFSYTVQDPNPGMVPSTFRLYKLT